LLITGLLLSVAINIKATAEEPVKTIITRININMYFPIPGEPWDFFFAHDYIQSHNQKAGLYNIDVSYIYIDMGSHEWMDYGHIPSNSDQLITTIHITAIGENTNFDPNIQIRINGSGIDAFQATMGQIQVSDRAIRIGGSPYVQQINHQRLKPPSGASAPPTYHRTLNGQIIAPSKEPTELPDFEDLYELMNHISDMILEAKTTQTQELITTLEEQMELLAELKQENYEQILELMKLIEGYLLIISTNGNPETKEPAQELTDYKELITAIQEQTTSIIETLEKENAKLGETIQRNFNMTIVFSLVTIGAITGIAFLVKWRPTND
jgi:hypothetical protein